MGHDALRNDRVLFGGPDRWPHPAGLRPGQDGGDVDADAVLPRDPTVCAPGVPRAPRGQRPADHPLAGVRRARVQPALRSRIHPHPQPRDPDHRAPLAVGEPHGPAQGAVLALRPERQGAA